MNYTHEDYIADLARIAPVIAEHAADVDHEDGFAEDTARRIARDAASWLDNKWLSPTEPEKYPAVDGKKALEHLGDQVRFLISACNDADLDHPAIGELVVQSIHAAEAELLPRAVEDFFKGVRADMEQR